MKGKNKRRHNTRKHARRQFHYSGWIDFEDGSKRQACRFVDVSATGARVAFEKPDLVPPMFTLWLATDGSVRRRCLVIWSSEDELGVQFLLHTKKA